ncbi:MAG: DUF302 domain-containing protein [Oceanospirillaceae bacterium]
MLKIISILTVAACLTSQIAVAETGIIAVKSKHDVTVTTDNLSAILKSKGMTVFSRIDHAAGAAKIGESIPPTQLLVFGNPKIGTKLMQCSPSAAIDLPMKALIWQDDKQQTWIGYNSPKYLASRHAIKGCDPVLNKVEQALANFANKAAN